MFTDWLNRIASWFRRAEQPTIPLQQPEPPSVETRFVVATGVLDTLFGEYAAHRRTSRGSEEIGWLLVGYRTETEVHVVGTIPAGTHRDASAVHVEFDSESQTLASRIIRQSDRRLRIVGIVHTHPGSMRQPSDGDLHGDLQWIRRLQNSEGLFAIGTSDGRTPPNPAHATTADDLRFSWYALAATDSNYRAMAIQSIPHEDVGSPLRAIWEIVEAWHGPVNRICHLFAGIRLGIMTEDGTVWLRATFQLGWPGETIYLLLSTAEARYYWEVGQTLTRVDPQEPDIEVALPTILAELARRRSTRI